MEHNRALGESPWQHQSANPVLPRHFRQQNQSENMHLRNGNILCHGAESTTDSNGSSSTSRGRRRFRSRRRKQLLSARQENAPVFQIEVSRLSSMVTEDSGDISSLSSYVDEFPDQEIDEDEDDGMVSSISTFNQKATKSRVKEIIQTPTRSNISPAKRRHK